MDVWMIQYVIIHLHTSTTPERQIQYNTLHLTKYLGSAGTAHRHPHMLQKGIHATEDIEALITIKITPERKTGSEVHVTQSGTRFRVMKTSLATLKHD